MREGARRLACAPIAAMAIATMAIATMAIASACTTDTAGLARRDLEPMAQAGAGGMPAEANGPTGAAGLGQAGVTAPPAEGGAGSIAILNGVVDGGRLVICISETTGLRVLRTELPTPEGGVGFGEVYRLPADWDLTSQAMEATLFAVTPAQLEGLVCDELMAASAPLAPRPGSPTIDGGVPDAGAQLVPFPTEPTLPRHAGSVTFAAGVLRASSHYVLVSAGCATPGVLPNEEICGPADQLSGAHQGLILAEFGSATSVEGETRFGLQFLNASRALGRGDLVLQGTNQRQPVRLANDVEFGAVRPRLVATVDEPAGLELHINGVARSDYTQSWGDTLSSSALAAAESRENYLVVYIGPLPTIGDIGFAPSRFVLIPEAD